MAATNNVGSMDDIIECNVLMADLAEYDAFNAVYASFFTKGQEPARAAYQVVSLPKGARTEVKCSANYSHPSYLNKFVDTFKDMFSY